MKKLILALAAVALLGTAAQAQKINKEALLQKIEKNETASADAKERKPLPGSIWVRAMSRPYSLLPKTSMSENSACSWI